MIILACLAFITLIRDDKSLDMIENSAIGIFCYENLKLVFEIFDLLTFLRELWMPGTSSSCTSHMLRCRFVALEIDRKYLFDFWKGFEWDRINRQILTTKIETGISTI